MVNKNYFEPVIGLEIHVQLRTKSKMFCGCRADWFEKKPNTVCCPVCLGLPGALPVPNKRAVEWCVMLGLALKCDIPLFSKFDRKNYFYPDLPKGYQISQYDKPLGINGWLRTEIQNLKSETNSKPSLQNSKRIRIRRVHLEEDTGKLLHTTIKGKKCTLVDFNRSGVPLVEIVTEPDLKSSEEAKIFLKKIHKIIRYLNISDADMEKGSMRIEPNISIKVENQKSKVKSDKYTCGDGSKRKGGEHTEEEESRLPSYKVEIKNINSFNFTKKAIDYEIERQIKLLKKGETPKQETRGWDEKKGKTFSQRGKEEAHDYRYFPEPDIPPIRWSKSQISNLKSQIPELSDEKIERFVKEYKISNYNARIITDKKETALYFEKAVKLAIDNQQLTTGKTIADWIVNKKIDIDKATPEELVGKIAKQLQKPTITDEELTEVIKEVIYKNRQAVSDYKSGKNQAFMFLIGQVMKKTRGEVSIDNLKQKLKSFLK